VIIRDKNRSRKTEALELKSSAQRKLFSGNYVRSKEEYRLALTLDPRIISEVILDYERILEKDSKNMSLRLSLADLYLRLGNVDSAMVELEEL